MLFAGRLIDKIGTKAAYSIAIIVWSSGAIMHAYALPTGAFFVSLMTSLGFVALPASIVGFMLSRAVLALGEAGNFPAAIKATAEYFPKHERSFATGIFNSGANIGAILAPLSVPLIAATWGWQAAFVVIGGIGFVWLVLWQIFYDKPESQKRMSEAERKYISKDEVQQGVPSQIFRKNTPWIKLLSYRQTWSFMIGKFLTDGVWWFFLFWLPKYLESKYQMHQTDLILPLTVLYSMTMIGSIGGGWLPAYFMGGGVAPYTGRMKQCC